MTPKINLLYLAILIWGFNILIAPFAYFFGDMGKFEWFLAFFVTAILMVYTLFIIHRKNTKVNKVMEIAESIDLGK